MSEDLEERHDWAGVLERFGAGTAPALDTFRFRRRGFDTSKIGGVYVVVEDGTTTPCKIGWALNLYGRRHGLNIGNPRLLVVKGNVQLQRVDGEPELRYRDRGMAFEERVHTALAAAKIRGEWFAVECSEAIGLIEKTKTELLISPYTG